MRCAGSPDGTAPQLQCPRAEDFKYFGSGEGGADYGPVANLAECGRLAAGKQQHVQPTSSAEDPQGCFRSSDNSFVFNYHPTGGSLSAPPAQGARTCTRHV